MALALQGARLRGAAPGRVVGRLAAPLRRAAIVGASLLLVPLTILLVRAFDARRGPPLQVWHRWAPAAEVDAATLRSASWDGMLDREARAFRELDVYLRAAVPAAARTRTNRYNPDGPLYAPAFARDWNRSFALSPAGPPRGAALLLHGLTDSPYSVRALARRLAGDGWVVVAPRLPGHGTTPAGLERARWQDWRAMVRLAAAHAAERAGGGPLVVVGYSNGGALALDYALDARRGDAGDGATLPRPRRLVLLSPMIGVHVAARLAPWIRRLGSIPYFARSRWIDVWPEYVPFKYSSFPAHAAEQGLLLSQRVRQRLADHHPARDGALPPVLVFQSLVDSTVSTAAVADGLFAYLDGDDELVLFDVNRLADVRAFLPPDSLALRDRLVAAAPRRWRLTLVTNRDPQSTAVVARLFAPGVPPEQRALGLHWPAGTFSLSHVALPFPLDDPLWGLVPSMEEPGLPRLGGLEPRGETGVLAVPVGTLMRLGCNPFFPYLARRTGEWLAAGTPGGVAIRDAAAAHGSQTTRLRPPSLAR